MSVTVTVVVPTYNRVARLATLLEALGAQRSSEPFEVVVVDDASPDDTPAVVERFAAEAPFPVLLLRQPANRGPAAARNRGWRAGQGHLVCFTDDDCRPTETWVAEMTSALGRYDVVQGRTLPDPADEPNRGPFSHTLRVESEVGYYETANMGYHRSLLERLGGFDETFRFAYGEDCELAWRAKQLGARIGFAEGALVHHTITPSRWRSALRGTRRHEGMVQVFARHPDLRRHLQKGVFYQPTHAPALAALAAGLALLASPRSSRRWVVSGLLGLWYSWRCRLSHAKPAIGNVGWLAVVPGAFIVDLADVAVLAQASARYRTLVL